MLFVNHSDGSWEVYEWMKSPSEKKIIDTFLDRRSAEKCIYDYSSGEYSPEDADAMCDDAFYSFGYAG